MDRPANTAERPDATRYTLSNANIVQIGSVFPWKPEITIRTGLSATSTPHQAARPTGCRIRTSSKITTAVTRSARLDGVRISKVRWPR